MELINAELRDALFKYEDRQADIWIGAPMAYFSEKEIVPFKFVDDRYVMIFQQVSDAAGGEEHIAALAPDFAAGFMPDSDARIMKFSRADAALEEAFSPGLWRLSDNRHIYQFMDLLRTVVESHVSAYAETTQYFYAAASPQLQMCYARTYQRLPAESCLKNFEPVSAQLGNYYGFQRKKSSECGNIAIEAR